MSAILLPIILTFAGLLTAVATYQSIRRGGARFYTLEREAVLRRATLTLLGSTLLFIAAVAVLAQQQLQSQATGEDAALVEGEVTVTPTPELGVFPPSPSPSATADVSIPTATPTPILCRAIVEGTSGNGLTLRDTPGGADIGILPEATFVTLIKEEPPQEANGLTWRKIRNNISGDEGWVANDFLSLGPGCE